MTHQPISPGRREAEQQLERLRTRCDKPNAGTSVMRGMYLCAVHGLDMPDWLRQHFARRVGLVQNAELGSWNDAFGRPWSRTSPEALAKERARIAMRKKVYSIVWDRVIREHKSIDPALFAEIASELGSSGSSVSRAYYAALDAGSPNVANVKRSMSS